MNRIVHWMGMGALLVALAGCNHPSATETTSANTSPEAKLQKPAATADENTWGSYLAEQGKLHGKDVGMHPYIYVIPAGESIAANDRRENEIDSVVHSIGPILMPGGMLILGGADGKQTTAFIADLAKQVKADSLKGIVVLVVSERSEEATVKESLKASGAAVRFVAM
ncbi:hypothetical protein [Dyella japonica]|uniref:Uncharacterized protein n=1 Tax=Dyella japonica TaxID=231455 RepID=A0ABV2JYJ9_9GAMM